MIRIALMLALALIAPAAWAWEASVDGGLCTLTHTEDSAQVRLTFDPSVPLYTITIARPDPWPVAERFVMRFSGVQPNTITTNRHVLSPDMRALSVSDRGFGNVLDGLQYNDMATGISGSASTSVSLGGAGPAVEAFRSCGQTPSV